MSREEVSTADPMTLSSKRVVYIGGLAEEVTVKVIRAAMIPFGDIKRIDMPMDYISGTQNKGFCFCEYEDPDDAAEAIFNMDGATIMGRTVKASLAQANQVNKLLSGTSTSNEAIWKSDEWFQQTISGQTEAATQQKIREQDSRTLQDL